ncbi:glutamyl-tRNA synthetase [Mycoplasmopsis mustelae]|uniref:Glutamate--tRNA ligase n=1 Tax=Mycoplasmopsis mustelae TaxID=171289 RepID=A0A4V3FNW7_9BACT|nr:glutamate--tRNA ligase [Mycoplasmopsis mustelae]TDV24130.1 glutamyl-tRNA synthetase [Mycoplasmopsis mustelae]
MKKVRTRYAPSPTGYLHIGGARTALFNYLFAKHFGGDFIFRLEDTDIKRNVEGGEASQLDNLVWLGIIPDESPLKPNLKYGKYRQSEKLQRYQEVANWLINQNYAYKAYDTPEELEAQKQESDAKGIPSFRYNAKWLQISESEKQHRDAIKAYSIRLRMPKNQIYQWSDIVRGEISFNSDDIGDWVIFKSDGYPTYNFAVVVDDHDMQISHILRGEEHIGNTPKQIALYQMLKWETPQFGHLTIITNMEGKKLSKRDTSLKQFIEDYKNEGYLPDAIFNFLSLLGWTAADATELMDKQTNIVKFDPQRLSKSPSKFDISKMNWFSKQYMKNKTNNEIIEVLNLNNLNKDHAWVELFIDTFKQSAITFEDLKHDLAIYLNYVDQTITFQDDELKVVQEFSKNLSNSLEFSITSIQNAINLTSQNLAIKGKKLFMPIRLATTSKEHGPELAKAIYLFGQEFIKKALGKY